MLQAVIHGGQELDEARTPLPLTGAALGSLAYLPLEVGLAALAAALGWPGWPPPSLGEGQVQWRFWPQGWLDAPGGVRVAVRPALLLVAPDRVLAVEGSWLEEGAALAPRLEQAAALARRTADGLGPGRIAAAALLDAHLQRPPQLPEAVRWASWGALHAQLACRAAAVELAPGLQRLVADLGRLLLRHGLGGAAGMAGLQPAAPPLGDAGPLQTWRIEPRWEGWGGLPPGPGAVGLDDWRLGGE